MIGFRLKLIAFAVVIIMALNLSPLDLFNNSASAASPPPDDGIDGFQVIDGSWDVSSQEEYTDEIIELNGNLIIHNGGVLTFNNVTLCMNITSSISKYYIEVQSGGRLIIQDKDGDPSTSDDASNITDSIYDYDNLEANASDYRYYFKVQSSGILKIINSNIRECGSKNGQTDEERGLYADSARLEISNTTFTNCYYTMFITGNYIEGVRNTLINYTTFARCTYGVILKNMDNVLFDHLMAYNYNHHVIHTDNVDDVYYKNCTFYNQLSSSTYVVYAYNSEGHYFSGCEFNKTLRTAIYLNNNGNIRVQNCSFISIPDHGILNYANYRPNHYFYDNIFSQISTGHHALYNDRAVNLNILRNHVNSSLDGFWSNYLSKVKIEHNRIQNCTRRAIHIYKSDTLIVTNNTIDHIKSTDWGVVMDQSGPIVFNDNHIYNAKYGTYSYYNRKHGEYRNNTITGKVGSERGFHLRRSDYTIMENNYIANFLHGYYFYEATEYTPTVPLRVYAGKVTNCTYHLSMWRYSLIDMINVTFDPSKIFMDSATGNPTANVYFNIEIYVHDATGPIGGAIIDVVNATKENSFQSFTQNSGRTTLLVLNGTYKFGNTLLHAPYNISANVSGNFGYPLSDYNGSGWQKIDIYFSGDIEPADPLNIQYKVNQSSVEVYWDCYVNDLASYKILRQGTTGGWVEVDDISSPPPGIKQMWVDTGNADNLLEYRYKIHHVDSGANEGTNDYSILYDDWVFTTQQAYLNQNITINGSLIIENGGDLEFKNINFFMTESLPLDGDLIDIRSGGKLKITDGDDNYLTKADRTVISTTANNRSDSFGFIVKAGGELRMENSAIQNSSRHFQEIDRACNIFADGGVVKLFNNTLITTDYGVYLESADGSFIDNNIFDNNGTTRYQEAIHLIDSGNVQIVDNTFNRSLNNEIAIEASNDITVSGNSFNCENRTAIHVRDTDMINIEGNILKRSSRGIILHTVNNFDVKSNNISNFKNEGIYINNSNNFEISNNTVHSAVFGTKGIFFVSSSELLIAENTIYDVYSSGVGITGEKFFNVTIEDNDIYRTSGGILLINNYTIENVGCVIVQNNILHDYFGSAYSIKLMYALNYSVIDNTIYESYYGIYSHHVNSVFLENNTANNCTYGFYQIGGERNMYHYNRVQDNIYSLFFISNAEATVYNCTIPGAPPYTVYVNSSSSVTLINPYFDLTKVYVSDTTCQVEIKWAFDIVVLDQMGAQQKDIFLLVRNVLGTILYTGYTNANSRLVGNIVLTRVQYYSSNTTFTPHTFEAGYGNHSAKSEKAITSSSTIQMQLDNDAPSAYDIIVSPLRPETNDDLYVNYLFSDPEDDANIGANIKWYKNSIYQPSLDHKLIVDSSNTNKGEFWYCEVTPFDGADFGSPSTSTYSWVVNSKPVVSNITITPIEPDSTHDLTVNYTYSDADLDSELGTIFRWYKKSGSNLILQETSNEPYLDYTLTKKNDIWQVRIEPRDGETFGDIVESENITIGNSPPWAENVTVFPQIPNSTDVLTAVYDFIDIDLDPEGSTEFQWYRMGAGNLSYNTTGEKNRSVPAERLSKGDRWMCSVRPHDGNQHGLIFNSTEVIIENSAPTISNVKILPSSAMTTDELHVSYNFYDKDKTDTAKEFIYEWLRWSDSSGIYVRTGLRFSQLPSIFTLKDEIWICEVVPYDGYTYGVPVRSDPTKIENSPPKASSLSISPGTPMTMDSLTANYDYLDDNKDPENGTFILWYKDGKRQIRLDNMLNIDSSLTSRGETWYFSVIPNDGFLKGTTRKSPDVKIINSPPEVLSPVITNSFPRGDEKLEIDYTYYDSDGDGNRRTDIRWYRDGILQSQYNNWLEIAANETVRDQEWNFQIRAYDGNDTSKFNISSKVIIRNSKPTMTEYFPISSSITLTETETQEFSVKALDMDEDVLIYQWVIENQKTFEAVGVGEESTFIYITNYLSAGDYKLNVTVQDWGTNSYRIHKEWYVTVLNNNRLPIIIVDEPLSRTQKIMVDKTLRFEITAYDLDSDDDVTLIWYLDGIERGSGTNHYTYSPGGYSIGKPHTIEVVVSDGHGRASETWNITVLSLESQREFVAGYTWDQWSVFIQIIVIIATGVIGFVGFRRLRKKRGVLQEYMSSIEKPMKGWKSDPEQSEIDLIAVVNKVEEDYDHGIIEDLHYFLLDRQIKENLKEMRQWKIDSRHEYLPPTVMHEVAKILEDGKITDNEYSTFAGMLVHTDGMTAGQKEDIKKQMKKWRNMDRGWTESKKVKTENEKRERGREEKRERKESKEEKKERKEREKAEKAEKKKEKIEENKVKEEKAGIGEKEKTGEKIQIEKDKTDRL